jgi:creatinine amidohydrolase
MLGIKKIFVFAIMTSLVFFKIASDDVSPVEGKSQEEQNVTSKSLASEGYSIFQETMADMTWQEVEKAAEEGAVILLPTAVIEEHGPHMGCGVDTYLAYQTCKLARRELESRGIKALIVPPFYWGINRTTHVFPGTFTVRDNTMKAVLTDILSSLKSWGFNYVFNINWHYDGVHLSTLLRTIIDAQESLGINVYFVMPDSDVARFNFKGDEPFLVVHKNPPEFLKPREFVDLHAGGGETGIMAAHFPDQVNMELTRTLEPTRLTMRDVGKWVTNAREVTPLGYFGDPAGADIQEGGEYHRSFCINIADSIQSFLKKKGYTSRGKARVNFASESYSIFHETMVDMTWPEVEKAAKDGAVILLNTAVIEEHGPHLVNGIDSYLGYLWCKLTRRKLESKGIKALIAPPFYWGINRSNNDFPGTFTVREETLEAVLHDTLSSLKSWGFTRIFNINSHGDGTHFKVIVDTLDKASKSLNIHARFLLSEERAKRTPFSGEEPHILFFESPDLEKTPPQYMDVHAGWLETGLVAAYFPGLVDVELARTLKPTRLSWDDAARWVKSVRKVTPLGYAGDPAAFDTAEAKKYVDELTSNMADAIAKEVKKIGSGREEEARTDTGPYAPYVGQYTHPRLGEVKVFEQNNTLAVDIPKQMRLTFNGPDEKGVWTCLLSNQVYLTFSKDDSGKVEYMSICQAISMPRKEDAGVSLDDVPEKYKPFVGKYLFQAINAEIEMFFQDGSLTLRDPDGDTIPLEFSEEKGIWEAEDKRVLVEFEYDEEGRVKGIMATHVTRLHKD